MPVPSLITDLSTTVASNSPSGSDNVFPDLDNYLRALSGFVASIRDNSGNGWVSPYLPLAGGTVTGATTFSSTVALNGALSGTGLTTYLASPPAIGGTTPNTGAFTTLAASSDLTLSGGTANGVLYLNGSKVATSGSALTFDGGNLGLGVTPSAWATANGQRALQIAGVTSISQQGNGSANVMCNAYESAANAFSYVVSAGAMRYNQSASDGHAWFTAPSGTAGNAISFTQSMTLTANGNQLIGTTTENGNRIAASGGTNGMVADFINTTTNGSYITITQSGVQNWAIGQPAGVDALVFTSGRNTSAAGTERVRITSGGEVVVNDTAAVAGAVFSSNAFSGAAAAGFKSNASTVYAIVTIWGNETSGNQIFTRFATDANQERGTIAYNRAGGLVAYNTTSDYRAKDIIGPVQNPGATIDALKVYEGVMKGATQSRPMLIAHEAQEHAPYAVSGVKDEVNEDGTPKFQQMDVSSLVPLLLAEIQSLRARVAALEAQP